MGQLVYRYALEAFKIKWAGFLPRAGHLPVVGRSAS
jgi:hypothetical protein